MSETLTVAVEYATPELRHGTRAPADVDWLVTLRAPSGSLVMVHPHLFGTSERRSVATLGEMARSYAADHGHQYGGFRSIPAVDDDAQGVPSAGPGWVVCEPPSLESTVLQHVRGLWSDAGPDRAREYVLGLSVAATCEGPGADPAMGAAWRIAIGAAEAELKSLQSGPDDE